MRPRYRAVSARSLPQKAKRRKTAIQTAAQLFHNKWALRTEHQHIHGQLEPFIHEYTAPALEDGLLYKKGFHGLSIVPGQRPFDTAPSVHQNNGGKTRINLLDAQTIQRLWFC
jgi:hypothetical protein